MGEEAEWMLEQWIGMSWHERVELMRQADQEEYGAEMTESLTFREKDDLAGLLDQFKS